MIILPDRNIPRAKFLMPVFNSEWKTPSLAQTKDYFGNENTTKFKVDAKSNDGVIVWTGWFDDREDFDAFLYAIALGTLKQEKALWDLPTPNWQPYLGELVSYNFATVTYLTTAGSLQTYNVPTDWNVNNNVQTIGGGGSGGKGSDVNDQASGGGGGAWNKSTGISLTRGGTASYQIGATVTPSSTTGRLNGSTGNDTWFNGTSIALSSVGSKAGGGGSFSAAGSYPVTPAPGGVGGVGSSGVSNSGSYSGGSGAQAGSGLNSGESTGGGGAAGPNGNGNNGEINPFPTTNGWATNGGSGDAGFGGAGGAGGGGGVAGAPGGNGSELGSGFGSGGGGGGSPNLGGGDGGNYGGGGGAVKTFVTARAGAGTQGLIIISYTNSSIFNMPNLGL